MDELALKNHKPLRETAGAFAFAQLYASTCTPAARPRNRRTWATFQPAVTGKATAAASDVEQREPTSWARGRALATIEVSMAYDNSDGRQAPARKGSPTGGQNNEERACATTPTT